MLEVLVDSLTALWGIDAFAVLFCLDWLLPRAELRGGWVPFWMDTFRAAYWIKSSLSDSCFKSLSGYESFLKLKHFAANFTAFLLSSSFSFSHFCNFSVNYLTVSSNFVIYCDFNALVLFKACYFALFALITDDLSSFSTEIYASVCFLNSSYPI
jgi:hypothetical protein